MGTVFLLRVREYRPAFRSPESKSHLARGTGRSEKHSECERRTDVSFIGFIPELSWVQWTIIVVVYSVVVIGAYLAIDYFVGARASEKFAWTFGIHITLPLWLIAEGIYWGTTLVKWPFEYRRKRLFDAIFGFPAPDYSRTWEDQRAVDRVLSERASNAEVRFQDEEKARQMRRDGNREVDLAVYADNSKYYKEMFWQAHGLAKHFGFEVRGSIHSYLNLVGPRAS